MITLNIPLDPVAKGRPRFGQGRTYTPTKTRVFENDVILHVKSQYKNLPLVGPLKVWVCFYVYRPKKPRHPRYPFVKTDLDNYQKAIFDACNGLLYVDDCQICEVHATKVYDEHPRIVLQIEPLT